VRHHDCRGRKAVAESIGVVSLKWLFNHTSVVIVPCLKLITKKRFIVNLLTEQGTSSSQLCEVKHG
jgi:hypothetical protein